MSQIHIRRSHHTTLAEAKKMADQVAAKLARDYDLKSRWQGNTLHFTRSGVQGSLAVGAKEFAIDVTLGLLMAAFKAPIQQAIEANLDQLIHRHDRAHAVPSGTAKSEPTGKKAARRSAGK